MAKTVFISFDYDNDSQYKNLLTAWDKHHAFDFSFYDGSLKTAVNSTDATYIKSRIKPKIQSATHLLCIIGKNTSTSDWISWEINTAINENKKLIGVKIDNSYTSPSSILGVGASWAKSFTFDAIKAALDAA